MNRLTKVKRLYKTAERQGGFFTVRQAQTAGYTDNTHSYHVQAGHWIREWRGIYRLAHFPSPARPDLVLWQLWSQNRSGEPQGTFSHATALALHDLSDVMPARLHMTVPPSFQRMAAIPAVLHLHRGRLKSGDVETIDGVRVTTALRTLVDVIVEGTLAQELQVQAVDEAIRRGAIRRGQLEAAKVSTRARQRIDRVLKQIPDGDTPRVRNRQGASRRPRSTATPAIAS